MFILQKIYHFLIDTIQTVLLAASFFLVIYIFLFRPFQVSGSSMHPTFVDGEYILTNLITLRLNELKKGDVIVFEAPTDKEKDFIKRVIGVGGDSVSIVNGDFYLNGQKMNESAYLNIDVRTYGGAFLTEGQTAIVPQGEYFAAGDNRPHSSDSRQFGFIKKEKIIGKSMFVYWPPNKMRLVKNPF